MIKCGMQLDIVGWDLEPGFSDKFFPVFLCFSLMQIVIKELTSVVQDNVPFIKPVTSRQLTRQKITNATEINKQS